MDNNANNFINKHANFHQKKILRNLIMVKVMILNNLWISKQIH